MRGDPNKSYRKPSILFHETTSDKAQSIKDNYLIPQHGDIVSRAYGEYLDPNEHGEDISRPATFFSTDPKELGGYMRMAIGNKLNKPMDEVTWDDVHKHGLLVTHEPEKAHFTNGNIYYAQNPMWEKFTNLDGEPVSEFEHGGGSTKNLPASVEEGDFFSLEPIEPHSITHGDELVNYLKANASNRHIDEMNALALRPAVKPAKLQSVLKPINSLKKSEGNPMDDSPAILKYKVLVDREGDVRYVVDHTGSYFNVHHDAWDSQPTLDGLQERQVMPSDISLLTTHGLLGENDYHILSDRGLISPTVQKIYRLMQELKSHIKEIESALPQKTPNTDDIDEEQP